MYVWDNCAASMVGLRGDTPRTALNCSISVLCKAPCPWCGDWDHVVGTLWLFNIAMGNDPFIDGLPINSMVIFHGYVSHNQMVAIQ